MVDYLKHWQAKAPVFTSAPDTDALYFTDEMKQFAERMRTGFVQGLSVMSLSGAIGCGKSTLLRWIYDTLDPDRFEVMMVVLFKSETTSGWLTPRLASMLGAGPHSQGTGDGAKHDGGYLASLAAIGQRLDEIRAEGRRLVILVDSCERIQAAEALEELSALVDGHLTGSSIVSILLVGNNEFQNEMLSHHSSATSALASRIGWRDRLPSLGSAHIPGYISSRLRESGLAPDLFTAEAADIAARLSNGNLHLLNSLCENALVDAAEAALKRVNVEAVQRAAKYILNSHMQSNVPPAIRPNSPEATYSKNTPPAPHAKSKPPLPTAKQTNNPLTNPTGNARSADSADSAGSGGHDSRQDQDANVPLQSLFKPKTGETKKKSK